MFARRRFPPVLPALLLLVTGLAGACSPPPAAPPAESVEITEPGQVPSSNRRVIVVLGDSLTAGLGLLTEEAFPARLQELFWNEGYTEVEVVDAGVSGDTTAGGARRVAGVIQPNNVRILVVALGGNDALRGLSVAQTRQNLQSIIDTALEAGVDVLLTGMEAPTNLGDDYRTSFRNVFSGLNAQYQGRVSFVPFLLEGVAGDPSLNQADGIHPNQQGAQKIAELLYQPLQNMVDQLPTLP
jgi:acyl-CoA thioesterase-1